MNDTPTSFFSSSRGSRQENLLSLLLFVIVMEALSKMISAAIGGRGVICLFVGPRNAGGIDIFHLLFVDDTLIFCGANLDHLYHLRCLF